MKCTFRVRDDLSYWACDAGKFESGQVHELEAEWDAVRQLVSAEAAGSIAELVVDGVMLEPVVESQLQSEIKLRESMGEIGPDGRYTGPWMEGHIAQLQLENPSEEQHDPY